MKRDKFLRFLNCGCFILLLSRLPRFAQPILFKLVEQLGQADSDEEIQSLLLSPSLLLMWSTFTMIRFLPLIKLISIRHKAPG